MVGILIQQKKKHWSIQKNVIKELKAADAVPTMITIGNEVNYNFLTLSSWDGYCAMAEISKIVRDAGIKAAFSFAAPEKASDIQYIIEQLGYACEKYEGAGYDHIGVNIYPNNTKWQLC